MSKTGGFITLHRQILDWEWYKNINVKVLFLHLLLKANYKELSFEGHKIPRGQLVTSLPSLSAETGLSIRQVRGSLEHLIETGEVTSRSYPRYRIITIVKYDDYQIDDSLIGSQTAGETEKKRQSNDSERAGSRQASDRLVTGEPAPSKQYNNSNKETKKQSNNNKTPSVFVPPTRDEVEIFCLENGLTIDIDRFLNYYTSNGWMVGRNKMKDWTATVRNWAAGNSARSEAANRPAPAKRVLPFQDFKQRDYSGVEQEQLEQLKRDMAEFKRNGGL